MNSNEGSYQPLAADLIQGTGVITAISQDSNKNNENMNNNMNIQTSSTDTYLYNQLNRSNTPKNQPQGLLNQVKLLDPQQKFTYNNSNINMTNSPMKNMSRTNIEEQLISKLDNSNNTGTITLSEQNIPQQEISSNYNLKENEVTTDNDERESTPDQPFYVNAKQYYRILKRRYARARLEENLRISRERKPYLHESRHKHAMRRPRGQGGRFLTAAEIEVLKGKEGSEELKDDDKDEESDGTKNRADNVRIGDQIVDSSEKKEMITQQTIKAEEVAVKSND